MPISQLLGSAVVVNGGSALGADLTIGTQDAYSLVFITNNTERARFTSTGEFIVTGSITTINSTVVDIADRIITVNKSAGANDPVPTLITGISVYRGAVASVARDKSTMLWDEGNSRWNLCLNTGADELTIGADQALKLSALTASGNLAMSTNNTTFVGRNAANNADVEIVRVNTSNAVSFAVGGADMAFGSGAIAWSGAANKALSFTASGTGTVDVQSATGAIRIGTTNAARTISIGTGTLDQAIAIGNGAANNTVALGSANGTSSLTLEAGSGTIGIGVSATARAINIGTGAAPQTIQIATGAAQQSISLGNTSNTNSAISLNAGATGQITANARVNVKSAAGLYVTDASSNGLLVNQVSGTTHQIGVTGTTTTVRVGAGLELSSNLTAQVDKTPNLGAETLRFNTLTSQTVATKTHDGFSGSQSFVQTGAFQCTGFAANTIATIAVPDFSCMWIEASIVVRDIASANRAAYVRQACVHRNGAGAIILTGVLGPATVESAGVAASWDASIVVSGNNALVTFTNAAGATTLNVAATIRYQSVVGNA